MRRTQEGFVPFKDDKTKDAENTDFEAGSNNTPMANRFQVTKMKNIVHEIDPGAYISISEVADVYKSNQ